MFIFLLVQKNEPKKTPCHLAFEASLNHSILTEIYKLAEFMPGWVLKQYIFLYVRIFVFSAK